MADAVPQGTYNLRAKATTQDGKLISCLTMEKKFKKVD